MTIVADYVKVSISMPSELVANVKEHAGAGGVSAYVTEAVKHRLEMEGLAEIVAEMEERYGPPDPVEVQHIIDRYFS